VNTSPSREFAPTAIDKTSVAKPFRVEPSVKSIDREKSQAKHQEFRKSLEDTVDELFRIMKDNPDKTEAVDYLSGFTDCYVYVDRAKRLGPGLYSYDPAGDSLALRVYKGRRSPASKAINEAAPSYITYYQKRSPDELSSSASYLDRHAFQGCTAK
jgi:hypothetical protein